MSFDERLFGWLHRVLRGGASRGAAPGPNAVELGDITERLELLASALAGQALTVRPAEGEGGVRGATLLLPSRIEAWSTRELNLAAYVHRVAYSVASRALGFTTAGLPEGLGLEVVATLLAMPATRAWLEEELPAAASLRAVLLEAVWGQAGPGSAEGAPSPGDEVSRALVAWGVGHGRAAASPEGSALLGALILEPPHDQTALVTEIEGRLSELRRRADGVAALLDPVLPLFGRLRPPSEEAAAARGPEGRRSAGASAPPGGTEHEAPPRDDVKVIRLGGSEENENPLVHSFEKVHTLDDYRGGSKRQDSEDELDEQLAALDELDLTQVVRTPDPSPAVLKLEGIFEGMAGDLVGDTEPGLGRPSFRYDEWDARRRSYRRDWCTLYLEPPPAPAPADAARARVRAVRKQHARQLRELRALLEALEMERRWRNRQLDGAEVDVDALVERRGALAAGRTPDDRVYARRLRHERELATLVLLDLSLSSDSWIDDRRILDVARDAIIVLGEVLHDASDHFAVAGFQSHTRRDCRWLPIKGFDDAWPRAVERMLSVEPAGYTRIGPALRHAVQVLSAHPARRRLLLVVTDGKPTDYDRYEGRYGMDDVRQAFHEAESEQIHPFAVTIAETATSSLPRMFGRDHYRVLKRPDDLPAALAEVYARLAR